MNGVVKSRLYGALGPYGFIKGEDGIDRFFLPSMLAGMTEVGREERNAEFEKTMEIGTRVTFTHEMHTRGARAVEVAVAPTAQVDLAD